MQVFFVFVLSSQLLFRFLSSSLQHFLSLLLFLFSSFQVAFFTIGLSCNRLS
jgi:hypothetical protein